MLPIAEIGIEADRSSAQRDSLGFINRLPLSLLDAVIPAQLCPKTSWGFVFAMCSAQLFCPLGRLEVVRHVLDFFHETVSRHSHLTFAGSIAGPFEVDYTSVSANQALSLSITPSGVLGSQRQAGPTVR